MTSISGSWADPTYDAAGNMTSGPKAGDESTRLHYVYNAWNQLVAAYADNAGQPGTLIATYEYDGQGRRIQKTVGNDTLDYYLNEQYQIIETRLNGDADPIDQWVFDVRYVDAPIVRFHDANTDGDYLDASDNIFFVMQDANFNVTGIVSALTGGAEERYVAAPYGGLTILAGDFSGRSLSSFAWITGHQGLAVDIETGLVYNRARYLDTSMGRFTIRDPLGYVDGMSLYQYVKSGPTQRLDSTGLYWSTISTTTVVSADIETKTNWEVTNEIEMRVLETSSYDFLWGRRIKCEERYYGRLALVETDWADKYIVKMQADASAGRAIAGVLSAAGTGLQLQAWRTGEPRVSKGLQLAAILASGAGGLVQWLWPDANGQVRFVAEFDERKLVRMTEIKTEEWFDLGPEPSQFSFGPRLKERIALATSILEGRTVEDAQSKFNEEMAVRNR